MVDREVVKGNVKYVQKGVNVDIEIFGNPEGFPSIVAVVPAPDLNCRDETERQARFDEAIENLILAGQFITSMQRIRNTTFDRKDQKTTLQIKYRPCTNDDEIKAIHEKITVILEKRIRKLDETAREAP